jgi:hypothetical protein
MGWRQFIRLCLLGGVALVLSACGFADSRAPVPSFMRIKEADPPPEPVPDVKQLVHDKMDSVFVSTSYPHDVRVSRPLHDPRGPGWTACVKADRHPDLPHFHQRRRYRRPQARRGGRQLSHRKLRADLRRFWLTLNFQRPAYRIEIAVGHRVK